MSVCGPMQLCVLALPHNRNKQAAYLNRSFAPCVPYQEFLAYGDEITRVKFRLASPRAARRFRGAHARRMRITVARVAAVDNGLRPISTGVKPQSAPS